MRPVAPLERAGGILPLIAAVAIAAALGALVGLSDESARTAILVLVAILGTAIILYRPHLGLALIMGSLPIINAFAASLLTVGIALIGGELVLVYLARLGRQTAKLLSRTEIIALVFLIWITVTSPNELSFSLDDRNWVSTFIQLWILMWLVRVTLQTSKQHESLMWVFCTAAVISAAIAVANAGLLPSMENRQSGLSDAINSAARYFTAALVFLYYLRSQTQSRTLRTILVAGMVVVLAGTIYTVSRTGLLIVLLVIVLLFFTPTMLSRKRSRLRFGEWVVLGGAFVIALTAFAPSNFVLNMIQSSVKSILEQSDTVGIRYGLWEAGLRMVERYPITGVGIGQYQVNLPAYASDLLDPRYLVSGAHSTYIQILSETGLVGFALFMMLIGGSALSLLRAVLRRDWLSSLALCWLLAFVVMLTGSLTKDDSYDKLLWMCMGAASWVSEAGKRGPEPV